MTDPTTPATPTPADPAATPAATPAVPATAAPVTPAATPAVTAPSTGGTPPPTAPTPAAGGTGGPAKPGPKLKPVVAIGAIVGAVAVVGGGVALFGGSKDSEPRPPVNGSASVPTVPFGVEPLDPTVGPQPQAPASTVPPPGPGVEPVITTTTVPPVTTAPPPVAPAGNAVEVGNGISVVPAAGWSVGDQQGGYVQVNADSGTGVLYLSLFDSSIGKTIDEAATNYMANSVQPYIADLQTTTFTQAGPVNGNVVANGTIEYKGVFASQSGNLPVEGFIAVFQRSDGSIFVYEEMNAEGSYEEHKAAYAAMFQSIIPTI